MTDWLRQLSDKGGPNWVWVILAIFVLGVDSTQPWAIYLLQSN